MPPGRAECYRSPRLRTGCQYTDMSTLTFRPATADDVPACLTIRGQTRENAFSVEELHALGITEDSWAAGVRSGDLPGFVACAHGRVTGYCFGDRETGEIVVLALLPESENQGAGKTLLQLVVRHLASLGHERLFLACASEPAVRSHGFYRHLGWTPTGERDEAGDDILELLIR